MTDQSDYRGLLKSMPVLHLVLMPGEAEGDYILVDASDKALAAFGKPALIAPGSRLAELVPASDLPLFIKALNEASACGEPVSFRISGDMPGDSPAEGFVVTPAGSDGRGGRPLFHVTPLVGAADSVSLQRERDDAISLLTSVFDVSEVGIVVTDRHQRIVRVNESFIRIYGWPRNELIGREFIELVTADEREMARANHEEFLKNGIRSSGEMKLIRHDGNVANALFTTASLDLSHGRRFQVTTIMDITLRKQMEMTLRLAKEQADAASQAKSTFLANMSHELRTPLNAILGFSEMMMKETFGPLANDKYTEYLGDIHLSARHLLEIINEVLDMSKIEAGRVELDEEYVDIHQMVIAVIRMMDSRAFSSGVKIMDYVQPGLEPLYADPRLIRQILINLVGNAVKYSHMGGVIDIKAHITPSGDLRLIVADNGVGIPQDRIQEALEPFGQVSKTGGATGSGQGTGLGLPLARAMTELHGGRLHLESDVGRGTVATVEIPGSRMGRQDRAKKSGITAGRSPRSLLDQAGARPNKVAEKAE